MNTKEIYKEIADNLIELLTEKEKAYGQAYANSPEILKILYPDGVKLKDYDKLLYITRVLDKLNRIAQNDDTEDPFQDIAGYSLLAMRNATKD